MRWWILSSLVLSSVAHAADPEDLRPTDRSIAQPPGDFAPRTVPHSDPPTDGWWRRKNPCPRGTRLETKEVRVPPFTSYRCLGATKEPRPYTAVNRQNADREEWWEDSDDKRHGGYHRIDGPYEESGLYDHGTKEGRHALRARRESGVESFSHYRGGRPHGLAHETLGSGSAGRTAGGFFVDGRRTGTWLVWNLDGTVRARLRYRDGLLDGAQRWWTRDGQVVARGQFAAGDGTWTIVAPTGTSRSETRCHGRELVEVTAWDAAGTTTLHACGPAAPKSCGPAVGPPLPTSGVPFGAAPGFCDDPTVPPLGLF